MKNRAKGIYILRKIGHKQKASWILRAYLSALLIFFVFFALTVALTAVSSIAKTIEETLIVFGSGEITTLNNPGLLLRDGDKLDEVKYISALSYSQDSNTLVQIKAVNDDFFSQEKVSRMKMEKIENTTSLNEVILSTTIAKELNVGIGDRISLMVFDEKMNRTRPLFVFVSGLYESGYIEFDQSLIYSNFDILDAISRYEITTENGDSDILIDLLMQNGFSAIGYKQMYSAIYDNINVSVNLLNLIVVVIALLSGFFAANISTEYTSRDKKDIASAVLIGFSKKDLRDCYSIITILVVFISIVLASVLGLLFSSLLPNLLSLLDVVKYPFLQNYVLDFRLSIPSLTIVLMGAAMLLSSYLSLIINLRSIGDNKLNDSLV